MNDQERSAYAPGYASQWWAAVIVALLLVAISGIQALGPEELGIPPVAFRWLGIAALCLGSAQAFLPKVTSVPVKDYDEVKRAEILADAAPPVDTALVTALADELERRREERANEGAS